MFSNTVPFGTKTLAKISPNAANRGFLLFTLYIVVFLWLQDKIDLIHDLTIRGEIGRLKVMLDRPIWVTGTTMSRIEIYTLYTKLKKIAGKYHHFRRTTLSPPQHITYKWYRTNSLFTHNLTFFSFFFNVHLKRFDLFWTKMRLTSAMLDGFT